MPNLRDLFRRKKSSEPPKSVHTRHERSTVFLTPLPPRSYNTSHGVTSAGRPRIEIDLQPPSENEVQLFDAFETKRKRFSGEVEEGKFDIGTITRYPSQEQNLKGLEEWKTREHLPSEMYTVDLNLPKKEELVLNYPVTYVYKDKYDTKKGFILNRTRTLRDLAKLKKEFPNAETLTIEESNLNTPAKNRDFERARQARNEGREYEHLFTSGVNSPIRRTIRLRNFRRK